MNYKGYFRDSNEELYCVYLIGDTGSTGYTEVKLAADEPFTVSYETSDTPFDAMRSSTATINLVHNDYMQDILSPYAQGTIVKLCKVTTGDTIIETVWEGFLKPSIYDAEYRNEYETFEIVANDYLLTLQYLPYADTGYTHSIVTFKEILIHICEAAGFTDGFYWPTTKKVESTFILTPELLKISDKNFFTNDTNEAWNLDAVLEEICKYFGFTAMQWKGGLYLVDYQNYHTNNQISFYHYTSPYTVPALVTRGTVKNVGAADVRGDASISFAPIYNKAKVRCNFYDIEDFIPNIFDDNLLTNRIDSENFYKDYEVPAELPYKAEYPWGGGSMSGQKYATEERGDDEYIFYHRPFYHKFYDSLYYTVAPSRQYLHPTYESERAYPTEAEMASSAITRNYAGATIMDLGVVRRDYIDDYHQYIIPNKLDFTRYLCLSQKCMGYFNGMMLDRPMLKLKSGYKSIAPLSDSSFLILSYSTIFTKYRNRAYINPEWAKESLKIAQGSNSHDGKMNFKLKIGDKYWDGENWTTGETGFTVVTEISDENCYGIRGKGSYNSELKVLNNVSWVHKVSEEGYKISLNGIDSIAAIEFEILPPTLQFDSYQEYETGYEWNQYCFVKDLSIKCVQAGQDAESKESDVVYENVIDEDAVNELDEIDLKVTTCTNLTKPSYSNVIYYNGFRNTMLETIQEDCISGAVQKPELNIVEKFVSYYNTPTKVIEISLKNDFTPFDKVFKLDVEDASKPFIQLGQTIDYSANISKITFTENK